MSLEPLVRSWSNFECYATMVLATTVEDTSVQVTFDHAKMSMKQLKLVKESITEDRNPRGGIAGDVVLFENE